MSRESELRAQALASIPDTGRTRAQAEQEAAALDPNALTPEPDDHEVGQ